MITHEDVTRAEVWADRHTEAVRVLNRARVACAVARAAHAHSLYAQDTNYGEVARADTQACLTLYRAALSAGAAESAVHRATIAIANGKRVDDPGPGPLFAASPADTAPPGAADPP